MGNARLTAPFAKGRKALIVYVCAGDPTLAETARLVPALADAGADIIELGVPFSDPVADGPVIQAAGQRAMASGTTLARVVELAAALRAKIATPLVLMSYYNPLLRYGLAEFGRRLAAAGVDGVIVPDLPWEEAGPLREALEERGLDFIPLVAPTTPEDRLRRILSGAPAFIYCVSLTGVTGAREELPPGLSSYMERLRRVTSLPLALGFGIGSADHLRRLAPLGDGFIVGSAVVQALAEGGISRAAGLVKDMRAALDAL
ncbi:MAG TPA: tryptophan synthase subunit alpha [Peptococcaceae bacterium]|nr:MAG: Tryptophan synthase alpha chain [Moorella sp. 60_41]HBT47076.1 tryptophan synthase subunit alpha [Peptococcaceae bacterium]